MTSPRKAEPQLLIKVLCDDTNRWFVHARPDVSAPWTTLDDDDLEALLALARGVVTGEVSQ